jgi:Holliday junction resolvase
MRAYGAKRDRNEPPIVAALERIGCVVLRQNATGYPDLLVFREAEGLKLLEVKHTTGKLTAAQIHFRSRVPFTVVRSVSEALALFGVTA